MKETLYTIPLMDAFQANDECPFCYIERSLEQNAMEFILGSAYMESDIRENTDRTGFCKNHLKKMYDYGNALGNALMLKTHYAKLNTELHEKLNHFTPSSISIIDKFKNKTAKSQNQNAITSWVREKENSCYVCDYYNRTYDRYFDTFFYLYKKDAEFHTMIQHSKGFCLHHFGEVVEMAEMKLTDSEKSRFYPMVFVLMEENMSRIEEDLSWFVNKFDYRYKNEDWKNSKDAIPRAIQKLNGGYPSDPPYKEKK